MPVEARFSAPVLTGPVAHPASFTMGTGPFPGGRAAGGVASFRNHSSFMGEMRQYCSLLGQEAVPIRVRGRRVRPTLSTLILRSLGRNQNTASKP